MRKLGFLAVALISTLAFAGVARAAEPAKAAPAAAKSDTVSPVKAGDTVHVCGCGPECKCGSIQAGPGKCHCGKDLVKATVAKVEGDQISVKIEGKPDQVFKAPYKCGCGGGCNCTPAALGPGKCKCGKELAKNQ